MLYRKERIQTILSELSSLKTQRRQDIKEWQMKKGTFFTPVEADNGASPWIAFVQERDTWGGKDAHYWFRTDFAVPEAMDGKDIWLNISTNMQFWDAVNPQFLLFVNGEIVQGVDLNHREILIQAKAAKDQVFRIDLQAYSGGNTYSDSEQAVRLELSASVIEVDDAVQKLYYHLLAPYQIVSWLDEKDMNRTKLEVALNAAINLLDLRKPRSQEFYDSIAAAIQFAEAEIYGKLVGGEVTATCIGHTHIDVAWWWTVAQTREKSARSFATVLKLMEEYPDYKFMSSQPVLYQFVKERYPELYDRIRQRVKEGRWEVEGGMWVEADCNVTSGESLVRQILHGKKFFQEEFGYDCKILWLPDVFGYSANLPQILRKSGIDYFMTTKIAWNQINKLPCDTFFWEGIDGTEIFTHLITTQNANQDKDSFFTTYNGVLDSVSAIRTWERYQQKEINNDVLIAFGHGDGGGGTTREMLELGNRLQSGLIGAPKVRYEFSRKYFDELYARVADNPDLPRWNGELYLEYHRGTYTSMARNKRSNRKCEFLWQEAEFLSLWAERFGLAYPKQEIFDSWSLILTNQFHDILPGSSIKEVYEVTKTEYEALEARAHELIHSALMRISDSAKGSAGDVVIFNTLSFQRDDVVLLEQELDGLTDTHGEAVPVQKTHDGKTLAFVTDIPSKGYRSFTPSAAYEAPNPFVINGKGIQTPFYDVAFDDDYAITSLIDRAANRQVIRTGGKANAITAYEDKPMNYDNWDIDIYYTEKKWPVNDVKQAKWIEQGPVRATLLVEREFCDSNLQQKIHFYAGREGIDFETCIDWKQHQVLLKAEFDIDVNAREAAYDIQFGELTRPTHRNTSWDVARFEVCGHKWVDISEGGYGVSVLNDCRYGYSVNRNTIGLTLLKSGIVPNPVSDQEEHRFLYTLYPHSKNHREAKTIPLGYMINQPLYSTVKEKSGDNPAADSFISVDSANIAIETVKMAENMDGAVIRAIENRNTRTTASIRCNMPFKEVIECDLMENHIQALQKEASCFTAEWKPFEIKTFKIIF